MTKDEFIEKAKGFGYADDQIKDLLEMIDEMNADGATMKYEDVNLIQQPVY